IPVVYECINQLLADSPSDVVFDLALPGNIVISVLQQIPDGAAVLMQKPMGENYEQAKDILQLTRGRKMIAGVNFQLRYAPFIVAAREIINRGGIGELCDIEVNVNVYTPWPLWDFLYKAPRVEILYHSIHYIDLVRSFLGNPSGIYAKTVKHPHMPDLASVRSNIIMDYGDMIRANILTNHCHQFGLHNQQSYLKFEGTKGAIKIRLGVLMNYPAGIPDVFEYVIIEEGKQPEWETMAIIGGWFPHAFIGSMSEVMKAAEGSISAPDNSVEDCIHTMACVEAAYASSEKGAAKINEEF
ncbi:MAG: Gfo/Idh/MocA family oxidoreductase, partial [Bacteroidota bacterium]|nr:Gfo/Idh/MocA family oxidoreductase [Bacteroidota bacterium]